MSDAAQLPSWVEVRVLAPLVWHELVAEALLLGPSGPPVSGIAFGRPSLGTAEPPEGFDYVRTFLLQSDDSPAVREELAAALRALAERVQAPELAELAPEFHELPPEDYATSWRKTWRPFRVGRLCIIPPHEAEDHALRDGDRRLLLEPGGAFGSGRHATTRDCLRVIQRRVRGGETVLDAGSGSGILSVACALFGAQRTLGFDVDPVASSYADVLAAQNGTRDRCRFKTGGFEVVQDTDGPFDVVLANIYSDVIQENAARLHALCRPGGWFAFSGCAAQHRDPTVLALEAAGFRLERERVRGRWHTFEGLRP